MYVLKHLILAALRIVTGNGKSPAYIGIWLEILNTLYSVCHAAAEMSGENIDCFPGQINVFQERAGWLACKLYKPRWAKQAILYHTRTDLPDKQRSEAECCLLPGLRAQ